MGARIWSLVCKRSLLLIRDILQYRTSRARRSKTASQSSAGRSSSANCHLRTWIGSALNADPVLDFVLGKRFAGICSRSGSGRLRMRVCCEDADVLLTDVTGHEACSCGTLSATKQYPACLLACNWPMRVLAPSFLDRSVSQIPVQLTLAAMFP